MLRDEHGDEGQFTDDGSGHTHAVTRRPVGR
jgi:hypothetical protein